MPAPEFHVHVDPDALAVSELSTGTKDARPERREQPRRGHRADADRGHGGRTAAAAQSRRYAFRRS
jgi:hypothetical protein